MIKIISTIALFICFSVNGQTQKVDSRLLGKYSPIELQKMQVADPDQYQFLVNSVERGLFIGDIPQEKAKDIVFDGVLNIDPAGSYTYISLGKEILDRYQYFKIEGLTKCLLSNQKYFLYQITQNNAKLEENTTSYYSLLLFRDFIVCTNNSYYGT